MKKKNGYVFFSVLILMILVTSVAMSTLVINSVHAKNISGYSDQTKAYYIANAGLEIVYAALNKVGSDSLSAITKEQKNLIDGIEIEEKNNIISNASSSPLYFVTTSGDKLGEIRIKGDLKKQETSYGAGNIYKRYYFRIVSTGILLDDSGNPKTNNPASDEYTLTMFVYIDEPNSPKIYSGEKSTPE